MRKPPDNWFFAKRCAYQIGYWSVVALFNVFPLPQLAGFREAFAMPENRSTAATAS